MQGLVDILSGNGYIRGSRVRNRFGFVSVDRLNIPVKIPANNSFPRPSLGLRMPPRSRAFLSAVFLVAAAGVQAQEEPAVADGIGPVPSLVEQVQAVRRERRQAEADQILQEGRLREQVDRLEKELGEARAGLAAARAKGEALEASIAAMRDDVQTIRGQFAQMKAALDPVLDAGLSRLAGGIPFRKAGRLEAVGSSRAELAGSALSGQAEGIAGLCRFYQNELKLAGSVEVWNAPVRVANQDREVQAFQIRLGLCQQFFVAEDGQEMGVAAKARETPWMPLVSRNDRKQLLQTLEMLRGRAAPELVTLPFPAPAGNGREVDRDE